jgi:hypothetical protein
MAAIVFPANPSNAQTFTASNGTTYVYNSASGYWGVQVTAGNGAVSISDTAPSNPVTGQQWFNSTTLRTYIYYNSQWIISNPVGLQGATGASGGAASVTVYADTASLPLSGNSTGDQAFVTSNNRLYIWNGSGWYNISLVNTAPTITSVLDAGNDAGPYSLNLDGTPIVITVTATDPEEVPLTYSYSVTSGSLTNGGGTTATVSQEGNVFTITPSTNADYVGTFELTFTVSDGVNTATSTKSFTLADTAAAGLLWRYLVVTQSTNVPPLTDFDPDADHGFYESSGGTEILASHTQGDLDPGNANTYAYFASGADPLTGQRLLYDWDAGGISNNNLNSSGSGGTRAARDQVAGDFIAIGFATATSIDTLGHINFRTFQDGRRDRVPVSAKLQYYTGDVTQTYDSNLWADYATLNKGTITSGTHVWTNITNGSTITSTTG